MLNIDYDGDVARLVSGGKLLTDNFYNGATRQVGLKRYREQIERDGLQLQILPRRTDAPIFLEQRFRSSSKAPQVVTLRSVDVAPVYRITVSEQ